MDNGSLNANGISTQCKGMEGGERVATITRRAVSSRWKKKKSCFL